MLSSICFFWLLKNCDVYEKEQNGEMIRKRSDAVSMWRKESEGVRAGPPSPWWTCRWWWGHTHPGRRPGCNTAVGHTASWPLGGGVRGHCACWATSVGPLHTFQYKHQSFNKKNTFERKKNTMKSFKTKKMIRSYQLGLLIKSGRADIDPSDACLICSVLGMTSSGPQAQWFPPSQVYVCGSWVCVRVSVSERVCVCECFNLKTVDVKS